MNEYSTRQAAAKLGLNFRTIQRYLSDGKIPAPPVQTMQGFKFRAWTDDHIEVVRKLLPTIANGRKTRYQKLREKKKAAQPGAAVLRKTKRKRK